MRTVVVGARGSSLSVCQTRLVQAQLEARCPEIRWAVKTIKAKADQHPDASFAAVGGEGIFVKELEAALAAGEIDLAVHSMKDLPLEMPAGVMIGAVTARDDPRDALVSRSGKVFEDLPAGSRVGTSSLRRKSQLLSQRADLEMADIRGNVDTRLRKLDEGRYEAIVLAACGLIRLGLEARITDYFRLEELLPEPGQGALAIQVRADDDEVRAIARQVDDPATRACVSAERAMLGALGGGCRVPIAAYARIEGGCLLLDGAVAATDGSRIIRDQLSGTVETAYAAGIALGERLLARGAQQLLRV